MTDFDTPDVQATVATEYDRLGRILAGQPDEAWDAPSLCAGWRVREVVAHMTMPVRYGPAEFGAELQACGGDFTALSNRIAERDGALPTATLLADLRDETMHRWIPPGGDVTGALNHVVVHGLDITVPLGLHRGPDPAVRSVLDQLASGGVHSYFGVDLTGVRLEATDTDWSYGSGTADGDQVDVISGTEAELVLRLTGRTVPA